jgi:aspartyl-tRNA synthetase
VAEEPPAKEDLGWLALADRYVMEAIAAEQAEQSAARQPRTAKPAARKLTLAKRHVSMAEARVARQEAVVSKLIQDGLDAAKAQELLRLMHHTLDLRRQRLQALLTQRAARKPTLLGRAPPNGEAS